MAEEGPGAGAPPAVEAGVAALREGRLPPNVTQAGLRRHTARGVMINSAFQIGLAALNLVRRLTVAAFLTAEEFGLWGVLLATLFLVLFLKDAGVGDKFVQQSEEDQELAFRKLFTIELILGGVAVALAAVALPLFALAYGEEKIILPGLLLSLAIIGSSLQSPNIIYYRQMDFVRQRILVSIDPLVAFVITIGLAVAGAGFWSLVIGAVAGSFAGAAAAMKICPYRLGFHLPKGTAGDYFGFSWPLMLASGGTIMVGQATLLISTRTLGLAAAGAIALATSITQFSRGVDNIVTQTLYPGICAVRERADLLFEAFIKSNRLALMWGVPFGLGTALFASDFVHFVIGERWEPAIVILQALGIVAAVDQLGFNWSAFLRALGDTRPIASVALAGIAAFTFITIPCMIAFGLPGFAGAALAAQAVALTARMHYLKRLFPRFALTRHATRAVTPALPAVAVIGIARLVESGHRTPAIAVAEVGIFVLLMVIATTVFERELVRELVGYLKRARGGAAPQNSVPEGSAL